MDCCTRAQLSSWRSLAHCPQFRKLPSIPEKWRSPKKWPILTPKKVNVRPEEKSHSPNPYWHPLFAKNGVQIGQILPLWAHLYFTSSYRGSPPCTLSQHPDNRETWYSNVLPTSRRRLSGLLDFWFRAFLTPRCEDREEERGILAVVGCALDTLPHLLQLCCRICWYGLHASLYSLYGLNHHAGLWYFSLGSKLGGSAKACTPMQGESQQENSVQCIAMQCD